MEEKRELIYSLLRILGYMEIEKDGLVTVWKWSEELDKPIRIK